ncbi:MAG: amidohydrolase family protein [Actinomycetota bacterium]
MFDGIFTLPNQYDLEVDSGTITSIRPSSSFDSSRKLALVPCVIDCHVHLTFSAAREVLDHGVAGALDLGAPMGSDFGADSSLRLRWSGPLLTAPSGYPTKSWGANGYGLEIADSNAARRAVAALQDIGASMIKFALQPPRILSLDIAKEIVEESHARGLPTIAHALDMASVRIALDAGIDALAHAPIESLPEDLIAKLGSRRTPIISTLRAFGETEVARSNLVKLARAGCTIIYGTDLGNDGIKPGVDAEELMLLESVLGSFDAALASATSVASEFAGFSFGRIKQGEPATMMLVESLSFQALRAPLAMWIEGEQIK